MYRLREKYILFHENTIRMEKCLSKFSALRISIFNRAQMNDDNVFYLCRFFQNATGQLMMEFWRKQR